MTSPDPSRPPSLLRNPLSLVGLVIAGVSTAFGLPMMLVDVFSPQTQPYLGVVIYLVLPFVAGGGAVGSGARSASPSAGSGWNDF